MPLTEQAADLLRELVRRIENGGIVAGRQNTYPSYGQIHEALGLQMQGQTVGQSLKHQGLAALAEWTHDEPHPAIIGLIVNQETLMPGGGYFELFGRTVNDFAWWTNEVAKSLGYDWRRFLEQPELDPPLTPKAADLEAPPERVQAIEYRILRDTELARRIKWLHAYRCQICGLRIELPDGSFYAGAHHIQPLGDSHKGRDDARNILCVCPNDHAKLDLGAIALDLAALGRADGHTVGLEYIKYHNNVVLNRWQ
jgi:hypothetical protein